MLGYGFLALAFWYGLRLINTFGGWHCCSHCCMQFWTSIINLSCLEGIRVGWMWLFLTEVEPH